MSCLFLLRYSYTVSPEIKIFNLFFPEVLSLLYPRKILALVSSSKCWCRFTLEKWYLRCYRKSTTFLRSYKCSVVEQEIGLMFPTTERAHLTAGPRFASETIAIGKAMCLKVHISQKPFILCSTGRTKESLQPFSYLAVSS